MAKKLIKTELEGRNIYFPENDDKCNETVQFIRGIIIICYNFYIDLINSEEPFVSIGLALQAPNFKLEKEYFKICGGTFSYEMLATNYVSLEFLRKMGKKELIQDMLRDIPKDELNDNLFYKMCQKATSDNPKEFEDYFLDEYQSYLNDINESDEPIYNKINSLKERLRKLIRFKLF